MISARSQRGFTLLEILVAFVVLAAAVSVLYQTFSTGMQSVHALAGYSEAIGLAQAKLEGLGLEVPIKEGEESGTTDDRRFSWNIVVRAYTPPGSPVDLPGGFVSPHELLRATVTVTWDERGSQKRTVALSTVRIVGKSTV
ncbi:MAG: prepilin-type N-terminal cleavage/methylation domain-containing protein [Betaproteobacteria bacterium]